MHKWRIGIDEVGRGPVAGPVGVGVFAITERKYQILKRKKFFTRLKDSKALTEQKRQEWIEKIHQMNSPEISWTVFLGASKTIDKKGIVAVIQEGIQHGLKMVGAKPQDKVLLDGGIKAPAIFINQKTIIKGDEKEVVIALASIFAKVTRDEHMKLLAQKHQGYGFEKHKGYGTRTHYKAIEKYGLTSEHRVTFLKSCIS